MKLVSVAQMREIEKEADANGLSYEDMMENAGRELAYAVADLPYFFEEEEDIEILGLVGPGNNGGDTLVALTHLAADGWTARAYLIKRKAKGDELVDALAARHGADRKALVRYAPDAVIERLFAAYPPLATPEAERLGLRHDGDIDTLIRRATA